MFRSRLSTRLFFDIMPFTYAEVSPLISRSSPCKLLVLRIGSSSSLSACLFNLSTSYFDLSMFWKYFKKRSFYSSASTSTSSFVSAFDYSLSTCLTSSSTSAVAAFSPSTISFKLYLLLKYSSLNLLSSKSGAAAALRIPPPILDCLLRRSVGLAATAGSLVAYMLAWSILGSDV